MLSEGLVTPATAIEALLFMRAGLQKDFNCTDGELKALTRLIEEISVNADAN
jgi:hypothetical protein